MPYWLGESYQTAITDLDLGLIYRNIQLSEILESLLLKDIVDQNGKFLDYGGGYGMFVRIMRDKGFNFYRQDIHCQNLFAKHFDISNIKITEKFDLLTAIEVFEHLEDPMMEIEKMLSLSDNIFFSTELVPDNNMDFASWWYFAPEMGQHVSFFTIHSLRILAEKYKLNFYSNGSSLHMFLKTKLDADPFAKAQVNGRWESISMLFKPKSIIKKRKSLLQNDFNLVRGLINLQK